MDMNEQHLFWLCQDDIAKLNLIQIERGDD